MLGSANALQTTNALKGIMDAFLEYQNIKATEETKRTTIDKEKQESIAKINAQKEILLEVVRTKHAENMLVIDKYLENLDKAIELNNPQLVDQFLSGISDTLKNNPLTSIKNIVDQSGQLKITL